MRETKAGKRPIKPSSQWWARRTVTCKICSTEQELEAGDKPVSENPTSGFDRIAVFRCPTILPSVPLARQNEWICPGILVVTTDV